MKKIAIITARGGSKRIPRKNIKEFLGKPILTYSIETALNSGLFQEVMVSTDDPEIAEIAIKYGAKVPFLRSVKNSDDYSTTVDVILEVIECYKELKISFDVGCCIYPTAPFITGKLLKKCFELMINHSFDSSFPIIPYSFPIQRALKQKANSQVEMFNKEHQCIRSQDLEKSFHDSGQFYFFKVDELRESKSLWTDNTGAIVVSEMEAHDIDTIEDWRIAEFKYQLMHGKKGI